MSIGAVGRGWEAWAGSVYPGDAASTRLRVLGLAEPVGRAGGRLSAWSFLSADGHERWMRGGIRRARPVVAGLGRVREARRGIRAADVVLVQRECLPFNSLVLERSIPDAVPLVWDLDDALWRNHTGPHGAVRGSERKYAWLARSAAMVWAGNENVADWCREQGARNVVVVPTTTPIPRQVGSPDVNRRLAWVGSPSTGRFIEHLLHSLADDLRPWLIEVVGARVQVPAGLRVEQFDWTQEAENRALSRAWAGLYPIDTAHPLAHGKSGLKAVLFGGYGIPTIATRTRSTADIVVDGETGLLAGSRQEWQEALAAIADPQTRARMSGQARNLVEARFDPAVWGERCAGWLRDLALRGPHAA
jgi:hypothetical protein